MEKLAIMTNLEILTQKLSPTLKAGVYTRIVFNLDGDGVDPGSVVEFTLSYATPKGVIFKKSTAAGQITLTNSSYSVSILPADTDDLVSSKANFHLNTVDPINGNVTLAAGSLIIEKI